MATEQTYTGSCRCGAVALDGLKVTRVDGRSA
jgi:hypothetical protein